MIPVHRERAFRFIVSSPDAGGRLFTLRLSSRQGFFAFAQRLTFQFEAMGGAEEAIQQSVGDGRIIAQISMPMSNRQLAGEQALNGDRAGHRSVPGGRDARAELTV